jgi:colicin import membrane protein
VRKKKNKQTNMADATQIEVTKLAMETLIQRSKDLEQKSLEQDKKIKELKAKNQGLVDKIREMKKRTKDESEGTDAKKSSKTTSSASTESKPKKTKGEKKQTEDKPKKEKKSSEKEEHKDKKPKKQEKTDSADEPKKIPKCSICKKPRYEGEHGACTAKRRAMAEEKAKKKAEQANAILESNGHEAADKQKDAESSSDDS